MSKQVRNLLIVGLVVVVVAGGAFALWWSRGGGEASEVVSAPTLDVTQIASGASDNDNPAAATEEASTSEDTSATEDTSAIEEASATEEASAPNAQGTLFEINKAESTVNFNIDEDLMGSRVTVVGATNEIAGQIFVDFANPANSQVGTIRINMRTLTTDNEFRNRALRNDILLTSQPEYEFSDFVTTSIEGLPSTVTIGTPVNFTLTGTLTLRGAPQPITFEATVTPVSETQLTITATSTVKFRDLGVDIPRIPPSVANISEDVILNLNLVANAVDAAS